MKQRPAKNLTNILQVWKHYTIFKKLEGQSQEINRKQARLEDTRVATDAANKHDIMTVRLRHKNGRRMDPEMEAWAKSAQIVRPPAHRLGTLHRSLLHSARTS